MSKCSDGESEAALFLPVARRFSRNSSVLNLISFSREGDIFNALAPFFSSLHRQRWAVIESDATCVFNSEHLAKIIQHTLRSSFRMSRFLEHFAAESSAIPHLYRPLQKAAAESDSGTVHADWWRRKPIRNQGENFSRRNFSSDVDFTCATFVNFNRTTS